MAAATRTRIDPNRLTDFCTAVPASAGVPEDNVRLIADTLVQADLWGNQSHGVLQPGLVLRADSRRHDAGGDET